MGGRFWIPAGFLFQNGPTLVPKMEQKPNLLLGLELRRDRRFRRSVLGTLQGDR
jgi:hypothetical protein